MEREMKLSARLTALASMVTPESRVCDVGCDHGFLSIFLINKGISPHVLAMDVRSGPLSRAARHVSEAGLDGYIETRLSDGLAELVPGEADTVVCAGMGGRLMSKILSEGHNKAAGLRELILQPQSEIPFFRKFLREQGYQTCGENIVLEEGKFYPMMRVVPVGSPVSCEEPLFDLFGEHLLKGRHPVLLDYLRRREQDAVRIGEELKRGRGVRAEERLAGLETELADIRRAFGWFGPEAERNG